MAVGVASLGAHALIGAACFLLEYECHDGAIVIPEGEGVRNQVPVGVLL